MNKTINLWFWLYAGATAFVIVLLLLSTGCMTTKYSRTDESGEKVNFSSSSLWTKKAIKDVDYGVTRNGSRRFRLKGYANDQTEVMQAAIEAALRAYQNQPVKPVP